MVDCCAGGTGSVDPAACATVTSAAAGAAEASGAYATELAVAEEADDSTMRHTAPTGIPSMRATYGVAFEAARVTSPELGRVTGAPATVQLTVAVKEVGAKADAAPAIAFVTWIGPVDSCTP